MKVCKVIVTCICERNRGGNSEWPGHKQLHTVDSVYKMLDTHIKMDKKYPPGVDMDTIIVNNVVDTELIVLGDLPNNIKVINRNNNGGSFGVYLEVFQNTKLAYDYYLFTEDDIIIGGTENYVNMIIDKLDSHTGFVAMVGVGQPGRHAHGGVGLVSKNTLELVYGDTNPYMYEGFNRRKSIEHEIDFTNTIAEKSGLSVEPYGIEKWDFKRNLCIDYFSLTDRYASILENL